MIFFWNPQYSTEGAYGLSFIKSTDFVQKYLGVLDSKDCDLDTLKLIAGIIDTSKDGFISFPEFVAFEGLLCVADALYFIAFRLFDTNGNGLISFDEFEKVIRHTTLYKKIPFNMDGKFVRMYFGRKKNRVVTYAEFSQFLHVIVQSLILILYEIKFEDWLMLINFDCAFAGFSRRIRERGF
jgi:solute carrier family 25 aspartate/glutamate transporter 12/13